MSLKKINQYIEKHCWDLLWLVLATGLLILAIINL